MHKVCFKVSLNSKAFFAFLFLCSSVYANFADPVVRTVNRPSGMSPPDQGLAVGFSRVVSCVNGNCVLYSKELLRQLDTQSTNTMFKDVRVGTTFDPRGFYDHHTNRYIIVCTSGIRVTGSGVVIAVSKNSEPNNLTTDWYKYFIRASESDAVWADYPSVGFDQYNYYISVNMFTGTNKEGELDTTPRIWVIEKSSLLDNSVKVPNSKVHKINMAYTMTPVTAFNQVLDRMYVLTRSGSFVNVLVFENTSDYKSTVYSSYRVKPHLTLKADYPSQKGTTTKVNSGDSRFQSAVYADNSIWLVYNSATDYLDRKSNTVWNRIDPFEMKLKDSGAFEHPDSDGGFFYPVAMPDSDGNVNFIYNGVSTKEYISGYISAVCKNGTAIGPIKVYEGLGPYSSSRYGDYSGVSRDPENKDLVWGGLQMPSTSNKWEIKSILMKSLCPDSDSPTKSECDFDCGEHGSCNILTGNCVCDTGYGGSDCLDCAQGFFGEYCKVCGYCNDDKHYSSWNHGECNDGKLGDGTCICKGKWIGEQCESCEPGYYDYFDRSCRRCPSCVNGVCDQNSNRGACICETGWTGNLCDTCAPGYFGENCTTCPDCGDHGDCVDGSCVCDPNWTGETCSDCEVGRFGPDCVECPDCGNFGVCNEETGLCDCEIGWTGEICDHCDPLTDKCDICNCGNHGKCLDPETGECECEFGWSLPNCTVCQEEFYLEDQECKECPDCGDHGSCVGGECVCETGWVTPGYEHQVNYYQENRKVSMQNPDGYCSICKNGFYFDGVDCLSCPDCQHSGICNEKGRCECLENWDGPFCEDCADNFFGKSCSECPDCGIHGVCNETITGNGVCICDENWKGAMCEICAEGYYGPECIPCPDCGEQRNRGECVEGICVCNENWEGPNCNYCKDGYFGSNCRTCNECKFGECENSICNCNIGWTGLNCETCTSNFACENGGICRDSTCVCPIGWEGPDCSVCSKGNESPECFNCLKSECACGEFGVCVETSSGVGVCDCETGWEGTRCEICSAGNTSPECPWIDCGEKGRNVLPNICECDHGFRGRRCEICISQIENLEC